MEDRTLIVPHLPGRPDVALFGVFDGHAGYEVAQFAKDNLPDVFAAALTEHPCLSDAITDAFLKLDAQLRRENMLAGSTACVVVGVREADRLRILCANCGDSRAFLCRKGRAVDLSNDHKPDNPREQKRIRAAGGFVSGSFGGMGELRVDGGLAMTRALGDFVFKSRSDLPPNEQKVIAVPEVGKVDVFPDRGDEYVVIASDGVFDAFNSNSDQVLHAIRTSLNGSGQDFATMMHSVLDEATSSGDNVSMVVAQLVHANRK